MSSSSNNLPKTYKSMIQKEKGKPFEWVSSQDTLDHLDHLVR